MVRLNVVFIGAGDMAGALASRASQAHAVAVRGSKLGSESATRIIRHSNGRITEASDADIGRADLVLVAVPWSSFEATVALLQKTEARRVVSVVVPWTGDDREPAVGRDDSAAERFALALPRATVAGAFTSVSAATVRAVDAYAQRPTAFVACDDAETKRVVRMFAESLGFDSLDAGPLYAARFTEALGFLWTAAAFEGGAGEMLAFRAIFPA